MDVELTAIVHAHPTHRSERAYVGRARLRECGCAHGSTPCRALTLLGFNVVGTGAAIRGLTDARVRALKGAA